MVLDPQSIGVRSVSRGLYDVAGLGQRGYVDADLPADRGRGITCGMSRCEPFLRPREIQESDACILAHGRRHLGHERGDRLYPHVEVSQQLPVLEGREEISSELF